MTYEDKVQALRQSQIACEFSPEQIKLIADSFRWVEFESCLLYTSPSPRDRTRSRMPSSA